jgi:broad specificity phosphatase PhoE
MIWLIRHGEPAAGWGAHLDPGLSPLGATQAEAAARSVAEAGARRAVVSPLRRCRETARPFERLIETHARVDPDVGEIPTPEGVADRAAWLREAMTGGWSDMPPEFRAWRDRVVSAVASLPEGAAAFSHFVAINAVIGELAGDDRLLVFRPGHCSVTRLRRTAKGLEIDELGAEGPPVLL